MLTREINVSSTHKTLWFLSLCPGAQVFSSPVVGLADAGRAWWLGPGTALLPSALAPPAPSGGIRRGRGSRGVWPGRKGCVKENAHRTRSPERSVIIPLYSLALYAACACLRMCVHVCMHACVHACVHVCVLNALRPLHYEHATRNDMTETLPLSLHHGRDYI